MQIISEYIDKIFNNKYTSTILTMFLVLYGGLAGPKLSPGIKDLFKESIFRIIMLALIVYSGNKNIKLSLAMAILFLTLMQNISDNEVEKFANQDHCYIKCMSDTVTTLKSKSYYDKIDKLESWFKLNKHIIDILQKDKKKKVDLNTIWAKEDDTHKYLEQNNIYNNNVKHQYITNLVKNNKSHFDKTEDGKKKFNEILTKLKEGQDIIHKTMRKYSISDGCKNQCKPN